MRARSLLIWMALLGPLGAAPRVQVPGALAQTLPATSPASRPSAEAIGQWVRRLDDESPSMRESALDHLLHLPVDALPDLRSAVRAQALSAAQRAVLKPIVKHIFLTGLDYASRRYPGNRLGPAFLGVVLDPVSVNVSGEGGEDPTGGTVGVGIVERVPGFCGYAALRDGDVVVQILERPTTALGRMEVLRQLILACHPGETIHLKLLRQGRWMTVPVTLDAIPLEIAGQNEMQYRAFQQQRADAAEAYWREHFAPLVEPNGGG